MAGSKKTAKSNVTEDQILTEAEKRTGSTRRLLQHPGHLFLLALQRCYEIHGAILSDYDITPMQASAIIALYEEGGMSQNSLARLINMEPSNLHGLIKRLKAKGNIDVRPSENDARAKVVSLTTDGELLAEELMPKAATIKETILSPLSTAERKRLITYLHRMI